jgi:hypothetical protein
VAVLLKTIYIFDVIPRKIPTTFFIEIGKTFQKYI